MLTEQKEPVDNLICEMFRDTIRKYLIGYRKPRKFKGKWGRQYGYQQKYRNDKFERAKEFLFEKGVLERFFTYFHLDMDAGYIRNKVLKLEKNNIKKIKFFHLSH